MTRGNVTALLVSEEAWLFSGVSSYLAEAAAAAAKLS